MKVSFPKFDFIGVPVLMGLATALFVLEKVYPLRKKTRPLNERLVRNASVAATALPVLRYLLLPAIYGLAKWSGKKQFGLLYHLPFPAWLKNCIGFLLLDYSNYLWHVLLHRSTLLWRFHLVHHTDLDMDLSTAWRFHVGENIVSVPFRGGSAALIGVSPAVILFYEVIFEGCTAFHHSNLKLPFAYEKLISGLVVTPRMHGIHHSIVKEEMNSNFSVIFNFWDRLHRSLRLNIPQHKITIGTPAHRNPAEQTLAKLLVQPFHEQLRWQFADGSEPVRNVKDISGNKWELTK